MKTTISKIGDKNRNGVPTVVMDFGFEVTVEAKGCRREDGLTAVQVRQEIKEREAADGS